jgi:hypothetical protein
MSLRILNLGLLESSVSVVPSPGMDTYLNLKFLVLKSFLRANRFKRNRKEVSGRAIGRGYFV